LIWPVGIILLWTSNAWNVRDKLIGTLILPGGLPMSFFVFLVVLSKPQSCGSTYVQGHQTTVCSGGLTGIGSVLAVLVLVLILFSHSHRHLPGYPPSPRLGSRAVAAFV
jgi:hypothetical protein